MRTAESTDSLTGIDRVADSHTRLDWLIGRTLHSVTDRDGRHPRNFAGKGDRANGNSADGFARLSRDVDPAVSGAIVACWRVKLPLDLLIS